LMEITAEQLKRSMPGITPDRVTLYLPFLNAAMTEFEINTPTRAAAFLAQVGHESGSLRWMQEIWGPTPAQKGYEGRADLGNTQPGDGSRFRGRGPIQITGRANYQKYGDLLGIDLITNPEIAASKEIAFRIAGSFWQTHGLNEFADKGDIISITRKINGGLNGLEDRKARYAQAKAALN
jgi:putative chitinase